MATHAPWEYSRPSATWKDCSVLYKCNLLSRVTTGKCRNISTEGKPFWTSLYAANHICHLLMVMRDIKFAVCVHVCLSVSVCLGRMSSETAERLWLNLGHCVAIAPGVPLGEQKMWFSSIDSSSFWQPLFHIRSLDGSTVALLPCMRRYCVSLALTNFLASSPQSL